MAGRKPDGYRVDLLRWGLVQRSYEPFRVRIKQDANLAFIVLGSGAVRFESFGEKLFIVDLSGGETGAQGAEQYGCDNGHRHRDF